MSGCQTSGLDGVQFWRLKQARTNAAQTMDGRRLRAAAACGDEGDIEMAPAPSLSMRLSATIQFRTAPHPRRQLLNTRLVSQVCRPRLLRNRTFL